MTSFNNVNYALAELPNFVLDNGLEAYTRNGRVKALPTPCMAMFREPRERVIFSDNRLENPFLHLFDAINTWSGNDNIRFIRQFQPRFADYSDNGETFHGHYGARVNRWLPRLLGLLHEVPETRRAVLNVWDNQLDLGTISNDLPCNTQLMLQIVKDKLDLTVINRSNDLLWGLLGANVVQFSMLLELAAYELGVPIGRQIHFSNNLHMYLDFGPGKRLASGEVDQFVTDDRYFSNEVAPYPLLQGEEHLNMWLVDAREMTTVSKPAAHTYRTEWFLSVAAPALRAWQEKSADPLDDVKATDWQAAMRSYAYRNNWDDVHV